jgi:hypothetical protein
MSFARLAGRLCGPWARVITVFALWNVTTEARSAAAESASVVAASKMEALFSTWARDALLAWRAWFFKTARSDGVRPEHNMKRRGMNREVLLQVPA